MAEDEGFLRELIAMDVSDHGYEVRLAMDGAEAIKEVDKDPPRILLLDLLMPKVDGYGVLDHIKRKGYGFPVIVLSNLSDPVEQEKCLQMGAVGFLVKSNLDDGEIWERVRPYLEGKV